VMIPDIYDWKSLHYELFPISLCNVVAYVFSELRAKGYEDKFVLFFFLNFISYTNTNKIRTTKLYEEIITSREKLGE